MALRGRCLLLAGVSSVLLLDSQLTYAQQSNADGIAIGVPYVAQTSLPQLQLSPSAIKWQYELQTQQQQEHQQAPVESFSPPSFKGEAVGWLDIFVASTHNIDTFEIELELYSPIAGVEIDVQATDGGLAQLCQFKTITDMLNLPEPPSSDNTADGVMTQQDSYTQATALIFGVSKQLQGDSGTSNDIGKTNGGTGDVSELLCPGGSIPATSAKTSTFVVSMPSGSSADPNEEVLQVLKTSNPSDDAKENALQWLTTLQVTIRAEHAEQGSGKTNDSHQSEPEVDLEWAQPEDVHKFLQAKLKQVSFEVYSCSDNDSDSAEDCNSTNVVDVALLASDGNSLSHVGDVATSMVLAPPMLDASEDVTNSDEKPEPLASLSVGSLIVFDTGCENCDSQPPVLPVWIQTDDNLLISQFVLKLTDTMGNPIGVLKASSGLTSTFNFKVYLQQQQHDNVHVDVGEVDAEASFFPMQVTSVAPSTNALSKQMLIALTLNDSESADGSSSSLDSLLQECEAASFMNCVCLQAIVLAPSVASGEYYASEATQQHKLLPVSVDNSQACDNLFASATSPWNPFEDPAMAMLIDGNGNDDGIYNGNSGNSNGDGTDSNLKAVTMASVLSTSQSFGHYWEFVSSHSFEASVGNGLPEQQPQAPAVLDPPLRTVFAPLDFALEQSGEASEMLSVTVPSSAAQATFQMHGATAQLQPSTFANGVVVQSASGVSMLVEEAGELGDKFSICGVIVYVNSAITTQDGVIYPLGGALSQEACEMALESFEQHNSQESNAPALDESADDSDSEQDDDEQDDARTVIWPVVVGCVLAGCTLLFVAALIAFKMAAHRRQQQEEQGREVQEHLDSLDRQLRKESVGAITASDVGRYVATDRQRLMEPGTKDSDLNSSANNNSHLRGLRSALRTRQKHIAKWRRTSHAIKRMPPPSTVEEPYPASSPLVQVKDRIRQQDGDVKDDFTANPLNFEYTVDDL